MLMHVTISWQDIIQQNLWPYHLAVDIRNSTPNASGYILEDFYGKSHDCPCGDEQTEEINFWETYA